MKYKLDMDQMAEAEAVIEQITEDPDTIAFELVWRRHEMARIAGLLRRWKNGGTMISQLVAEIEEFISANDQDHKQLPAKKGSDE
jgi:hypothetical protein